VDAYVASLQSVHSSLAAKGDALDVVENKVLAAQVGQVSAVRGRRLYNSMLMSSTCCLHPAQINQYDQSP
jgi:hypothetical protein